MTQSSFFEGADGSGEALVDTVDIEFDGAARGNPGPASIGAVVLDGSTVLAEVSERVGHDTNNVAEYKALIAGLEAAAALGARRVRVKGDSKLVVMQVTGRWKMKADHLRPLLARVKQLLSGFDEYKIEHIGREKNKRADALANAALDAEQRVFFWFTAGSIFLVWNVFQSSGLDFRLIALGALVPQILDAPFGSQSYAHTLLAAVLVLLVAMLVTAGRGRRLKRRRALSLAIGWFCGLVLSASWVHKELFWWPAFGLDRPDAPLFGPVPVVVVEELLGLAAAWWTWTRFGLADPERRRAFWRTGRLTIVGEEAR